MVVKNETFSLIKKAQENDQEAFEKVVNDNMLLVYKLSLIHI